MIAIDKNIPAPVRNERGRPAKYPWRQMKKGDSFYVNGDTNIRHFQVYAHEVASRLNIKVATRMEGTGIRVWRIK